MRVLLDECVPKPLHAELKALHFSTVQQMGWQGKKNGELLTLMKPEGFDVLLTIDQNLKFQQNLQQSGMAVVIVKAMSNKIIHLLPAMPLVISAITSIQPGNFIEINAGP